MSADATDQKLARLTALEATTASLRHDLRNILSPALLVVDRLIASDDPAVARAGQTVLKAMKRAEERLRETKAG